MSPDGTCILAFEAVGLCIAHLGHLHHEPTPEDYALLGRLDVVMVPVDGGLTLDHPAPMRTLDRIRAPVVIPMHWWGRGTLEEFLAGLSSDFEARRDGATARPRWSRPGGAPRPRYGPGAGAAAPRRLMPAAGLAAGPARSKVGA